MTVDKAKNYDIVIVGAGLVGTSVIAGLQNAGFRIAVLETHLPSIIDPDYEDSRPISLAYGSERCLSAWGLWSSLSSSALPIERLHVSEQGRLGRVVFSASDYALPALGYVVPFSSLQRHLYQCAASQEHVDFIGIEKIVALHCDSSGARVEYIASGKKELINANLLIAADGAQSHCRSLLNIPTEKKASDEVAFIATLTFAKPHEAMAYQRFTTKGSLALLPLFDRQKMRLVWTMSSRLHEKISSWTEDSLLQEIVEAFGGRLKELKSIERDAVFPLQTIIAKQTVQPSMVLLGNAAHTIYPVAAQGFNLGLQDAAVLVQLLRRAKEQGQSIGAMDVLQRYVERRESNQQIVMRWTERVAQVFHWRVPVFDHLRGLALLGLDMVPSLKENFARNFLHV
ncbi:MAG: FAD-dependent monooxygenase [Coxiellaceae bacterium]|nr:FAD-dependent monooxygenase [Coxiellaceae bacterium]